MSNEKVDRIKPLPTFNSSGIVNVVTIQTSIESIIRAVARNNHGFLQSYGKLAYTKNVLCKLVIPARIRLYFEYESTYANG